MVRIVLCQWRRLTSTSYLVLGLLAREGPSTPYALERHVEATLGNFWTFPHTLLYSEPPRLAAWAWSWRTRESEGRRRRVFAITPAGEAALAAWLDRPSGASTELRDLGLLQLFFADLASAESRLHLAEQQLALHRGSWPPTGRASASIYVQPRGAASGPSNAGGARRCGWACCTSSRPSSSGPTWRLGSASRSTEPRARAPPERRSRELAPRWARASASAPDGVTVGDADQPLIGAACDTRRGTRGAPRARPR